MAKEKKQIKTFTPNTSLVMGEQLVAGSESDLGQDISAFGEAFGTTMAAAMTIKKARDLTVNSYIDKIGSIANITKIDDATNKQAINDFVKAKRDRAAELGNIIAQDPNNREAKDELDQIQTSMTNLNSQLDQFTEAKKEYLNDADKNRLADPSVYDKEGYYKNAFTDASQFTIDESGNIGHMVDGKNMLFKDRTEYEIRNFENEKFLLTAYDASQKAGSEDQDFNRDNISIAMKNNFRKTGVQGVKVMATTDLTSDDNFAIGEDENGNPIYAKNMSFKQMWSEGMLDEKFYVGYEADQDGRYNSDWMMENEQSDKLNDLMTEYYTDVMENVHSGGKKTYSKKQQQKVASEERKSANLENSAGVFNYDNEKVSLTKNMQTPMGHKLGVGDVFIAGDDIDKILTDDGDFESLAEGKEYKMGKDGNIYMWDDENNKWSESNAFSKDGDKMSRQRYNLVVKSLREGGAGSFVATPEITFEGTRYEKILQNRKRFGDAASYHQKYAKPGAKSGNAGWNMRDKYDYYALLSPYGEDQKYILEYQEGQAVKALNDRFGGDPAKGLFKFEEARGGADFVKVTGPDGKSETFKVNVSRGRVRGNTKNMIEWMYKSLKNSEFAKKDATEYEETFRGDYDGDRTDFS